MLNPAQKRALTALGVIIVAILILRVTVFRPFDSDEWKRLGQMEEFRATDPRRNMYLDLVLFHSPKGMSRDQVIELLGPPDKGHPFRQYGLVYAMGNWPLSLRRGWLGLKFEGDVVVDCDWAKNPK